MTPTLNHPVPDDLLEQLGQQGLDYVPEMIRILLNTAMEAERQHYLNAAPYERSKHRRDYANGFKPKALTTRLGKIAVDVPQVRTSNFYPSALEKGCRSERALTLALAEMYVQGVSTRKVSSIVEELCGCTVSSTQVSRATAELDVQLKAWRERPLGTNRYLYLDARYEKVRQNGQVLDAAVLIAVGVNSDGKRDVLGVSVATSEHEAHWRIFLQSLVNRGLGGIDLIISDAHAGLKKARQAVFGGVPWQRCQFHLMQNAHAYVPKKSMIPEVMTDLRSILNARSRTEAETLLKQTVNSYQQTATQLAEWMELNVPESLTVFDFPANHRRKIRTVNGLERLNREIARRTRVAVISPNENACLRLVSALLMEISEEWITGKKYINFENNS